MLTNIVLIVLLVVCAGLAVVFAGKAKVASTRIDQLERDLQNSLAQNQTATDELTKLVTEREQLHAATNEARGQLESLNSHLDAARQQIELHQRESEEARGQYESSQSQLDQYKSGYEQLQSEMQRLQTAESESQQQLSQLRNDNESMATALNEKDEMLRQNDSDRESLSARLNQLVTEGEQHQQDTCEIREYLQEQLNLESQRRADMERLIAKLSPFSDSSDDDDTKATVTEPESELLVSDANDDGIVLDEGADVPPYDIGGFGLQQ